jgi:murein DD-endopeptidase MepM/ murein hydrolase activator NlpD
MKLASSPFLLLIFTAYFMGADAYFELPLDPPPSLLVEKTEKESIYPILQTPELSPVPHEVEISSGYGMRFHPVLRRRAMHTGLDFPLPEGTPVVATATGYVSSIKEDECGFGKYLVLDHDAVHHSLYGHLSEILVRECQLVQKGDTIALSGHTGLSARPHLHFEVWEYGKRVDPLPYLERGKEKNKTS